MKKPRILAFVMAGGEGSRLYPLTTKSSKPALPFGGRYRVVDFVLSNLINSGIFAVYLLVQYKSQSLIEHIRKAWVVSPILSHHFVTVVPPQRHEGGADWFQGTADAVYQNLDLIQEHNPDLVAVFGADHVYRMDVRQMAHFHRERKAEISVAALPVPVAEASAFGIIATDAEGRVQEFQEKPKRPSPMPGDPSRAYASLGNYLFDAKALVETLEECHKRGETDFGQHVLPCAIHGHRLYAYDFSTNRVPGVKPYEEKSYWRDVGTLDAYFNAHQDLLGGKPHFDVYNPQWPIYSSNYQGPSAKIVDSTVDNCIVASGTVVQGSTLRNSVLRREVTVEKGVDMEDCLILDYVRVKRGAHLRRTIVGRYNVIDAGSRIGYDAENDSQTYHRTTSGIVVVPAGEVNNNLRAFSESD